jgi:hypothetical protein
MWSGNDLVRLMMNCRRPRLAENPRNLPRTWLSGMLTSASCVEGVEPPLLILIGVVVIKIRYSDLPPGLHASVRREGRHTVIYLVPGLSPADRHSAIGRLRASGRVGHGPKIPALPLGIALIADRIRVTLRTMAAAARLHPTGLVIPVAVLVVGAILYGLFVTVSLHIGPPSGSNSIELPLPVSTRVANHRPGPSPVSGRRADPVSASRLTRSGVPGSAGHSGGMGRPSPTVEPTPSTNPGGWSPPPRHPSPPPTSFTPAPPPSPSPAPSPSPTRSHGGGGDGGPCLHLLGLLGVCL